MSSEKSVQTFIVLAEEELAYSFVLKSISSVSEEFLGRRVHQSSGSESVATLRILVVWQDDTT